MNTLGRYIDFLTAVVIVVLYALRDNGILVLSAETITLLATLGATARGIFEARKRKADASGNRMSPDPGPAPTPGGPDDG